MLSLEGHKVVSLTLMFVITLTTYALPLYVRKLFIKHIDRKKAEIGLSACLCFGAGVLMANLFLHILPEASEKINSAMEKGLMVSMSYPITQTVFCMGFFLVYCVEELVHYFVDNHSHKKQSEKPTEMLVSNSDFKLTGANGHVNVAFESDEKSACANGHVNIAFESDEKSTGANGHVNVPFEHNEKSTAANGHVNVAFESNVKSACANDHIVVASESDVKPERGENKFGLQSHDQNSYMNNVSLVGTTIAVIALSLHGLLEGMSLGLETEVNNVWIFFAALISHKIFISFSVSMELLEVGVCLKSFVISMVVFSAASPLGGLIGSLVSHSSEDAETAASVLAPGFLQAISAGTILYVTFCEVLERERSKPGAGLLKFAFLLLGFSVMMGLQTLETDETPSSDISVSTTAATL